MLDFGTIGYQIGAAGIIAFTLCYVVSVRWWTDWLGRVIAAVLFTMSGVLTVTTLRQVNPEWDGAFFVVRAVAFWLFGITVWLSWAAFLWAQFWAKRRRDKKDE